MVYFKKIAYSGKYQDDDAIPQLIGYITQKYKTPHQLIGGFHNDVQNPAGSMIAVSNHFGKNSRIRLHHFVLSFDYSLNGAYHLLWDIGLGVASEIAKRHQIVFAVHEDTNHIHIHFVFNAVSYVDGKKYHGGKTEYKELIHLCTKIIDQVGLSPLAAVNYHPNPLDIQNSNE